MRNIMTDNAKNSQAPAQDENKLIAERRIKLEKIRSNCSANGFPNDFNREHLAADIQAEHGEKTKACILFLILSKMPLTSWCLFFFSVSCFDGYSSLRVVSSFLMEVSCFFSFF